MSKTFYEILGIPQKAATKEILAAYRDLVRTHHPDTCSDPDLKAEAEQFLKEVTEAFNTLGRPALRSQYDKEITMGGAEGEAKKVSPIEQAKEYFRQGMARLQSQDFSAALSLFDFALKTNPDDAASLFHAGMIRLKNPKWRTEGTQQVEAAIDKDPYTAKFVIEYCRVLLDGGQSHRARRILAAAQPFHPSDETIAVMLAESQGGGSSGPGIFAKKK